MFFSFKLFILFAGFWCGYNSEQKPSFLSVILSAEVWKQVLTKYHTSARVSAKLCYVKSTSSFSHANENTFWTHWIRASIFELRRDEQIRNLLKDFENLDSSKQDEICNQLENLQISPKAQRLVNEIQQSLEKIDEEKNYINSSNASTFEGLITKVDPQAVMITEHMSSVFNDCEHATEVLNIIKFVDAKLNLIYFGVITHAKSDHCLALAKATPNERQRYIWFYLSETPTFNQLAAYVKNGDKASRWSGNIKTSVESILKFDPKQTFLIKVVSRASADGHVKTCVVSATIADVIDANVSSGFQAANAAGSVEIILNEYNSDANLAGSIDTYFLNKPNTAKKTFQTQTKETSYANVVRLQTDSSSNIEQESAEIWDILQQQRTSPKTVLELVEKVKLEE